MSDSGKEVDPPSTALEFGRSLIRHACFVGDWDEALAASVEGNPPPLT